jgi:hypothetical protein
MNTEWLTDRVKAIVKTTRVQDYIQHFVDQTGVEVKFDFSSASWQDTGISNHHAVVDPGKLTVRINLGIIESDEDLEYVIAHEVSHGIMELQYGFYSCERAMDVVPAHIWEAIGNIQSVVQDIVADTLVQEIGISTIPKEYSKELLSFADLLRQGSGLIEKSQLLTVYIKAWSDIKYLKSTNKHKSSLKHLTKALRLRFPDVHEAAVAIQEIIQSHDVLTAEGNRQVIEEILSLMGLDRYVASKKI